MIIMIKVYEFLLDLLLFITRPIIVFIQDQSLCLLPDLPVSHQYVLTLDNMYLLSLQFPDPRPVLGWAFGRTSAVSPAASLAVRDCTL